MRFLTLLAQKIDADEAGIPRINDVGGLLDNGLNLVYFVGGIVAVIVIIIAGVRFVTSSGNADGITKARNMLLYGIVGLAIIAVAFTITQFVIGVF